MQTVFLVPPVAPATPPPSGGATIAHAETNEELIELWLFGKSPNTCDAYRRDLNFFCCR